MRTLSICGAMLALLANAPAMALGWNDACRDEVFKQQAPSYEIFPDRDNVNQKPWLPYCEGYLEGLFQAFQARHVICVPEGTRNFQVTGSVIVWFDKKATEEERRIPSLVAFNAWSEAFPCKKEDKKK
jgi:Rap1a immunity proteins